LLINNKAMRKTDCFLIEAVCYYDNEIKEKRAD